MHDRNIAEVKRGRRIAHQFAREIPAACQIRLIHRPQPALRAKQIGARPRVLQSHYLITKIRRLLVGHEGGDLPQDIRNPTIRRVLDLGAFVRVCARHGKRRNLCSSIGHVLSVAESPSTCAICLYKFLSIK